ncbi:pentatricopeptide repeat-containing protein At4g02750-like [Cryptomeria japonica]|uniref:pentatricopeptide repeat-containing protein At4g02750-like n=1 Tax=Cryptomeria japonica TaxID=3369 RepID=UPI0025AB9F0F|nr:pentatricopeptide repeat-containing protein At4g02750-like [Cryptomeria japonica]
MEIPLHIFNYCRPALSRMRFRMVKKSTPPSLTGDMHLLHAQLFHNKLINMYVKGGSLLDARKVFDHSEERDSVSWNTIIAAYQRHGNPQEAVTLFHQMQRTGLQTDQFTFASVLPACAKLGVLEQGYAQNGFLENALETFKQMQVAGYAQNAFVEKALETFKQMQLAGVKPDSSTFASILRACAKTGALEQGLVEEGCTYFNHMTNPYCITPTVDHYVCMVDLLARAGCLEDALNFIIKMPVKPVVDVWMCFLGSCRSHMNIGLGVFTAMLLFDLDPKNSATYVLLSNIYAEVGRWSEVQMLRRLMKDRGIKKIPGCSWIEGHKMVHAFCIGDRSHPDPRDICKVGESAWEM